VRKLLRAAFASGVAERCDGARFAFRRLRCAHRRAEFHQRLVKLAWIGVLHQPAAVLFAFSEGQMLRKQPAQNSVRVRINGRTVFAKRNRGDCARGVRTNPRQADQLVARAGKRGDEPRQTMQRLCASVVSEPAPRCQQFGFRSACNRFQIGKPSYELAIVRLDNRYLRLLKHQLGDQNPIRVFGCAPRQRPCVRAKPFSKRDREALKVQGLPALFQDYPKR